MVSVTHKRSVVAGLEICARKSFLVGLMVCGLSCVPVTHNLDALQQPPFSPTPRGTEVTPVATPVVTAERFQGPRTENPTTAESMVRLSDKYTILSDKAASLRENNRTLGTENDVLKQKIVALEADLQQTQTELTEANTLLMEILGELNTWKSDVLGFRSEMRQAAQAELEALVRILEVLGAETHTGDIVAAQTSPAPPESNP